MRLYCWWGTARRRASRKHDCNSCIISSGRVSLHSNGTSVLQFGGEGGITTTLDTVGTFGLLNCSNRWLTRGWFRSMSESESGAYLGDVDSGMFRPGVGGRSVPKKMPRPRVGDRLPMSSPTDIGDTTGEGVFGQSRALRGGVVGTSSSDD